MKIRTKLFYPEREQFIVFNTECTEGSPYERAMLSVPRFPKFVCVFDDVVDYTEENLYNQAFSILDFDFFDPEQSGNNGKIFLRESKNPKMYDIALKYAGKIRSPKYGDFFAFQNPLTGKWSVDYSFGFYIRQLKEMNSLIQKKFFVNNDSTELKDVIELTLQEIFQFPKNIKNLKPDQESWEDEKFGFTEMKVNQDWFPIEEAYRLI